MGIPGGGSPRLDRRRGARPGGLVRDRCPLEPPLRCLVGQRVGKRDRLAHGHASGQRPDGRHPRPDPQAGPRAGRLGRVPRCPEQAEDVVTSEQTFVVVGGNLTAGAAVTTLRDQGFDQRIVVIGEEPHPPYERPPLSKQYLRGESTADSALLHPPSWYADADVELRLGLRAVRLDPVGRAVELRDGERIVYDKLLIATGGQNRRRAVPGNDLQGSHQL